MLSFVVVVRVRVKVVREIFFVFWVFFVSVLAEKNKNTTDDVDSFFSLFCDGRRRRRDPQKKTTLMVFERENEREMGETLSARALKPVATFLRAAR